MPRTYKTGPARSRRRPDPATRWNPSQVTYPLFETASSGGSGTAQFGFLCIDPATAAPNAELIFQATGVPPQWRVLDASGNLHEVGIASLSQDGAVTTDTVSGLPAGPASLIIYALEPSVRTINGGWLGTLVATVTVT